jgi:predicted DNA-binding protein with PD1-like motif
MLPLIAGHARRIVFTRLEEGSKLPESLVKILDELDLGLAVLWGLGGFAEARIAVYDRARNKYRFTHVRAVEGHVLEVATLTGNSVRGPDGTHYPHLHVVVSQAPDKVYAGHLISATVSPFLELVLVELPAAERASSMLSARWTLKPTLEEIRTSRLNYSEEGVEAGSEDREPHRG